jgi:hypothetical protein
MPSVVGKIIQIPGGGLHAESTDDATMGGTHEHLLGELRGMIRSILGGLMTRFFTRALIVVAATVGVMFAQVAPASATVHEIVGQWCSGQEELGPPGISGGSQADNFAQPLNASGFIEGIVPFRDGVLVKFNDDNPNAKVVGTGVFVVIGQTPTGSPIYLEVIEPNPSFPAFQHCPRLATG